MTTNLLDRDDRVRTNISALFRSYGYDRYRTTKFETYEVYLRNKDYIEGDSIVTFTATDGKLMALRPDVTLGIINNLASAGREQKKLYYDENVFRRDKQGEYREIHQMGIEYIGGEGAYPQHEAVVLAIKSLALVGEQFVLSIGHMDIVESVLTSLKLGIQKREEVISCIRAKAFHTLSDILGAKGKLLVDLVSIEGNFESSLKKAKKLVGEQSKDAFDELSKLYKTLVKCNLSENVRLDFSLINDTRYYNGIVFNGFIKGIPLAVLTGGRYDKMMKRLRKTENAIGFALDVNALETLKKPCDVIDVLLIYGKSDISVVCEQVQKLSIQGKRVLAVSQDDTSINAVERVTI